MNEFSNWSELFLESLQLFGEKFIGAIPGFIGALLILLLGWLFARLVAGAITRLLGLIRFDKLAESIKADQFLQKANVTVAPSQIVGKFVYWILILLIIMTASETLGWNAVSEEISNLLGILPNLLISIVFFVVGTYIASFVRDFIKSTTRSLGISAGRLISSFVFYLLIAIVTLTALEQAGLDTNIITSNLLLIMGAILAAAAISYSIASKDLLANLLAGFFSQRTFHIGQIIEIDGIVGKIVAQNKISVTLEISMDEQVVIPTHQLITSKVRIHK